MGEEQSEQGWENPYVLLVYGPAEQSEGQEGEPPRWESPAGKEIPSSVFARLFGDRLGSCLPIALRASAHRFVERVPTRSTAPA